MRTTRRRRVLSLALLCGLATSCGITDGGLFALAGTWEYEGDQDAPSAASITGAMSWSGVGNSTDFEGAVAWVEELPGGATRGLSGSLAGTVTDDSIVDFSVMLSGVTRWHVGVLRGDSISGTWVDGTSGTASGTWVARREDAP